MVSYYRCDTEYRLRTARTQPGVDGQYVNGIDYLEVSGDRKTLIIHLLHQLRSPLTEDNIQIQDALNQQLAVDSATGLGRLLTVRLKQEGDRSTSYCLKLVKSPLQRLQSGESEDSTPPQGFDCQLSQVRFTFRTTGNSEVDCQTPAPENPKPVPPPIIDYLAKDYASFRQLILDRLTITIPTRKEQNPSDIGTMLVEILAYAADYLSYYQDAVATEAYLGTARRRMSVRRHARLLDYFMHDGCNARAWVAIEVSPHTDSLPFNPQTHGVLLLGPSPQKNRPGTRLLTRINDFPPVLDAIDPKQQELILKARNLEAQGEIQIFETLHDITLYAPCNTISFYTWGEETCDLPIRATQATLKDTGGSLSQCLELGMVLIFEEQLNPETGQPEGIDLTHRHAVRLTKVTARTDPLLAEVNPTEAGSATGQSAKQAQRLVEIEWSSEDALPFPLWIAKRIDGRLYSDITVAHGNVVLVDHGRTRPDSDLEKAKTQANQDPRSLDEKKLNQVPAVNRYRPHLKYGPLTHQRYQLNPQGEWQLFNPTDSARSAVAWLGQDFYTSLSARAYNVYSTLATKEYKPEELARAALDQKQRFIKPSIRLREYNSQEFTWSYQPDLLNSGRFDRNFVVETEDDGRAYLRFGDDVLGKRPEVGTYLAVTYRTGNGSVGNVGAESLAHIVTDQQRIRSVRNPLPAQGGIDPEPLDQVRLYAPQAFRVPQRAVTEADYARIVERFPGVQRAVASRRWTGSWYTIFVTVDRQGGRPLASEGFKDNLRAFLKRFRMAGHDLELEEPRFVPLDLALRVKLKSGYFWSSVKQALLDTFSDRILPNQQLGFFHPDQFSFGDPLYLSQVIKAAVQVEGVQSVEVIRFQRWGESPQGELKAGRISFDSLEILQLTNDPTNPSKGRISFDLQEGL